MTLEEFPLLQELLQLLSVAAIHFLGASAVALIGWLVARIVSRIIRKILAKTRVDNLIDPINRMDLMQRYNLRLSASKIISRAIYFIILLVFLVGAADVLQMPAVSSLVRDLINYIPILISAILVFILGILLADFLRDTVYHLFESLKVSSAKLISDVLFYFLVINVLIIALDQAKVATEFVEGNLFILLAGVVLAFAIGYGLASRDLVSNFLSALYNKDKIQVGDEITLEGVRGKIVYMDNLSIVLQQEESEVVIPLSKLTSQKFEVHSVKAPPPDRG